VIDDIPDPPPGSRIRAEHEHETVVLSWRARPWEITLPQFVVARGRSLAMRLLTIVWIAWLVRVVVGLFVEAVAGGGALELALVCLVGGSFIWAEWDRNRLIKRFRPVERLVISEDTLIHTPSARRTVEPYLPPRNLPAPTRPDDPDAPPPSHTWPSAFVRRRDAGDVRLAGKGASEIIALGSTEGELAIGRRLPHADREWLVEVLRRWKDPEA